MTHDPETLAETGFAFRLRRAGVIILITGYLGTSLWFFWLHLLGDSLSTPMAYFWTWDMFPGYATRSSQKLVLGETESGQYVQLLPGPTTRFRWGQDDRLTRYDLYAELKSDYLQEQFQLGISHALTRYQQQQPDAKLQHLLLLEGTKPAWKHLPVDLYQSVSEQPGSRLPSWEFQQEIPLDESGQPQWTENP